MGVPKNSGDEKPAGGLLWHKVLFLAIVHAGAAVGAWRFASADPTLRLVQSALLVFVGLSATAGGHRLFTHQCYEAAPPVHAIFALGLMMGFTGSAFGWIRTHRTHHQYTDGDLDPHDARKGMWHSHFGWMLRAPSAEIKEACALQDNHTLRFHGVHAFIDRNDSILSLGTNALVPYVLLRALGAATISAPDVLALTCLRVAIGMNMAACVNSFAHVPSVIGTRPYSTRLPAYDNLLVSVFTWGEGWHNYHHTHSKDYRASGHDNWLLFWNPAHALIEGLALLGLAFNLKRVCSKDTKPEVTINSIGYELLYKQISPLKA